MQEVSVHRVGNRVIVDISGLKRWVTKNVSSDAPLRSVISFESIQLSADEFIVKMDTWLKLSELENAR